MSANTLPLQQSKAQPSAGAVPPSFLQKKGLLGATGRGGPASIVSPTDNVLSPISAKLSSSKQRHFQKGKPMHLASQLSQLASSSSSPSVTDTKSKIDF
ncbi:hypothetical protein CI109_101215 [Kwoniella shandongensis]|uniref:Uncharacterized protein n=1 Tax=Kwoniella shandongensis TaxID=1734106 RepID=A0A5M6BYZ0_9TREE|nr:uncharacterized protein CI109_005467 [Kwoniella shandongensis]KAA5526189.1 hypothetical protein CI109_005467 [Kwoniella shandongensis]